MFIYTVIPPSIECEPGVQGSVSQLRPTYVRRLSDRQLLAASLLLPVTIIPIQESAAHSYSHLAWEDAQPAVFQHVPGYKQAVLTKDS